MYHLFADFTPTVTNIIFCMYEREPLNVKLIHHWLKETSKNHQEDRRLQKNMVNIYEHCAYGVQRNLSFIPGCNLVNLKAHSKTCCISPLPIVHTGLATSMGEQLESTSFKDHNKWISTVLTHSLTHIHQEHVHFVHNPLPPTHSSSLLSHRI
jgi:hypothetical protein